MCCKPILMRAMASLKEEELRDKLTPPYRLTRKKMRRDLCQPYYVKAIIGKGRFGRLIFE